MMWLNNITDKIKLYNSELNLSSALVLLNSRSPVLDLPEPIEPYLGET